MTDEEMITIPKKEYDEMKKAADKFYFLEGAGVDNWEGWDYAMEAYREYHNED